MSSIPRDALNTSASNPGAIGVANSRDSAVARAITSCGSEMSAGVFLFITSAAVYPSIRSAPTLKIWITPLASVAIDEKLALLKIALFRSPALTIDSSVRRWSIFERAMGFPDLGAARRVQHGFDGHAELLGRIGLLDKQAAADEAGGHLVVQRG